MLNWHEKYGFFNLVCATNQIHNLKTLVLFQWNVFYIFHSVSGYKFLLLFLVIQHIQELLVPLEIYKGNTRSSFIHHFISQCAY